MKKFFAVAVLGIVFCGFNFSASAAVNSSQKYQPPPARYAPPTAPDYGLNQPAYTPPPPPEVKK